MFVLHAVSAVIPAQRYDRPERNRRVSVTESSAVIDRAVTYPRAMRRADRNKGGPTMRLTPSQYARVSSWLHGENPMDRREAITATFGLAAGEAAWAAPASVPVTTPSATATPPERLAGVTIVRPEFPPGDVRRYGVVGDGAADDSRAWRAALASGHRVLGGGAEYVYRFDQYVPVVRACVIDLQGATIRPHGNARAFLRTPPPPT